MSEGQAFFPSKFRRVAIITSSSVCLWQTSSKGSLIPLGTTCDDRVRMRKPLFSTKCGWRAALEACVQWLVTILKDVKIFPRKSWTDYIFDLDFDGNHPDSVIFAYGAFGY